MPENFTFQCTQCGTEDRYQLRGVRALQPCTECNEVTTWEKM